MQAKDSQKLQKITPSQLELCGLAINIASFANLLKRVDFDAIVDHLALRAKQNQLLLELNDY